MSLTIGRVGVEAGRLEPDSISLEGDRLSISGNITIATETEPISALVVARDQLAGLADNTDERWVPLAWPEQPELEGIWEVASVDVDMDSDAPVTGEVGFSLDLIAVSERALPAIEIITVGGTRTNDLEVTDGAEILQGLPVEARQFHPGTDEFEVVEVSQTGILRWTDDGPWGQGQVRLHQMLPEDANLVATSSSAILPAEAWYRGACRITYLDTDGVRRTQVGGRLPADASTVRIDNGIMRASVWDELDAESGGGRLVTEMFIKASDNAPGVWDQHRWQLAQTVELPFLDDGDPLEDTVVMAAVKSVAVVRNGVEQVTVRISFESRYGEWSVITRSALDMTLRRGHMFVDCRWVTDVETVKSVAIHDDDEPVSLSGLTGLEAGTDIASELSWWQFMSPAEVTSSTFPAVGWTLDDAAQGFSFGLGHGPLDDAYGFDQGDVTVGDYTMPAPTERNNKEGGATQGQYFGAVAEQQIVVSQ